MANKEYEAGMVVGPSVVTHTTKGITVTEAVLKLSQERDKAYAELIIVSDSLRLANITIEQQKRTIEELRAKGHRTGGEVDKELAEAIARGKISAAREGRPYLFGERNDYLLNEAFTQYGQALKAEVVPEIQRVNAYLTITRVGEEETITAQVDGPESAAEHIGSALRGIAIALQRHDDCCDFGLDLPSLNKD